MSIPFVFAESPASISTPADFAVNIPADINSRNELFEALKRNAQFPSYFGDNWDALLDCLCDFNWVSARRIMIIHHALPQLSASELRTYLLILANAIRIWSTPNKNDGPDHELICVFPVTCSKIVNGLLNEEL